MQSLRLHAATTLQPTLSPRLQRAVKLLQLSSLDFSQVVRDALDTNPFLEADEAAADPARLASTCCCSARTSARICQQASATSGSVASRITVTSERRSGASGRGRAAAGGSAAWSAGVREGRSAG